MKNCIKITLFLSSFLLLALPQSADAQCTAPQERYNIGQQTTSADIAWTRVIGARRYRVRYRPIASSSWTWITTRSTDLALSNLDSGTEYLWQVRTRCRSGWSSYSPAETFTTLGSCPIPKPFHPFGIGSHQATLVWLNINNQVDGYNVRWREVGTSSWNQVNDIGTNLYGVDGLDPLTTYEYQVQSRCNASLSPFSSSEEWTTAENVCTAPQNFMVVAQGTDFVQVSWSAVGGSEHYRIRYREVGTSDWLFRDFIPGTSTTIPNLFPNTSYEAQVQSICTLGSTDWSSLLTFTTDQIATCDAPQNLFASMISASAATHNWDPVVGALTYTMRRRIDGTQNWTEFTTSQTSLRTSLLEPGTTYEFQVRTHCNTGDSPFSGSAFYTTQEDPTCPAATNLIVDGITPTSADFDWSNVSGVLHYRFDYRIQGSNTWTQTTTTSSHIGRTGLQAATTYEWRVGTLCTSGGTYTFTAIETFTTAQSGQCTTPHGLFVLGRSQTGATLLWQTIPEANSYDARIRETGSSNWTTFTNISTNLKGVSGLSPGTEYEFQVRAHCSTGSSPYSSSYVFSTLAGATLSQTRSAVHTAFVQESYKVFPNPSNGEFTIAVPTVDESTKTLYIYDSMGRQINVLQLPSVIDTHRIDLRQLEIGKGTFFIQIRGLNGKALYQEVVLVD